MKRKRNNEISCGSTWSAKCAILCLSSFLSLFEDVRLSMYDRGIFYAEQRIYVRYNLHGDEMNVAKDYALDMRITFKSRMGKCTIGGPITKGELLLMAFLIYASKGDISKPVGVSYGNARRFKKYCIDVSLPEFHQLCKRLSGRRGWCRDRCSEIGMLWIEAYQKRGWWGIYKLSHVLVDNVDAGNYMELVEKMLRLI